MCVCGMKVGACVPEASSSAVADRSFKARLVRTSTAQRAGRGSHAQVLGVRVVNPTRQLGGQMVSGGA